MIGRQSTLSGDMGFYGGLTVTSDGLWQSYGFDANISPINTGSTSASMSFGWTNSPNLFGPAATVSAGVFGVGIEVTYSNLSYSGPLGFNIPSSAGIVLSTQPAWVGFSTGWTGK
jgi:hypothetical protein